MKKERQSRGRLVQTKDKPRHHSSCNNPCSLREALHLPEVALFVPGQHHRELQNDMSADQEKHLPSPYQSCGHCYIREHFFLVDWFLEHQHHTCSRDFLQLPAVAPCMPD